MKDDDDVSFLVEHDVEMLNFFITVSSTGVLTMKELAMFLRSLANDIDKDPENFLNSFSNHNFECH